jgi:hypothetical protein
MAAEPRKIRHLLAGKSELIAATSVRVLGKPGKVEASFPIQISHPDLRLRTGRLGRL